MKLIDLQGKRVLITQAQDFMGPALLRVFGALGATVIADARPLGDDPGLAARVVAEAGDIDVLIAHLALPAPSTAVAAVDDAEWRHVFAHLVDPLPRLARAVLPQFTARGAGRIEQYVVVPAATRSAPYCSTNPSTLEQSPPSIVAIAPWPMARRTGTSPSSFPRQRLGQSRTGLCLYPNSPSRDAPDPRLPAR